MPFSLALSDARTEVIHLAAIDGKTGATSRHSPTRLNTVLNRKYRSLRSRVSQLGYPQFLVRGTSTPLPGRASGEDFQEIDVPAAAGEVAGVDVQINGEWRRLDPLEHGQRRDGNDMVPTNGTGFWSIVQAPVPSTTSITAGKIALWPHSLSGSYKVNTVSTWTDITNDTHVFMLYDGWDEWLLNAAAMMIATRDGNKRGNYDTLRDAWLTADALVVAGAARLQRGGHFSPSPYGGIEL